MVTHDKRDLADGFVEYGGHGINCFFDPSDIDASTGRVILTHGQLGEPVYSIVFKTYHNRPRVVAYKKQPGAANSLFNAIGVTDSVEIFCGFGPDDGDAVRIMVKLAAYFIAYGAKGNQ